MRSVLRVLGSRYGIATILAVVVLAVVGLAKAFVGDGTASAPPVGPVVSPVSTAPAPDASLGDDGVDDADDDPPDESPSPSLSAKAPNASTVASRFITAWLKHDGVTPEEWRAALKPNATADLIDKLKDTDPTEVPADKVTGDVTVKYQGSVAAADVPVDGGTVELRLIVAGGRWKVDGIDWDQT
jgi:hypothetical protein